MLRIFIEGEPGVVDDCSDGQVDLRWHDLAAPNKACGVAAMNLEAWNRLGNYAARGRDCALAQFDARGDNSLRAYPRAIHELDAL